MANGNNLIPIRSKDEARELGHRGGIASGEARREKKVLREIATDALLQRLPTGKTMQEGLIQRLIDLCFDDKARLCDVIKCIECLWHLSCQYNTDKKYDPSEPQFDCSNLWVNN